MEKVLKNYLKPVLLIWIISVLCFLPFISKGLTNSVDGLWYSSYYQSGNIELGSGRWLLLLLDKGRGAYAAEPFSSLFALFFVSIAVCVEISIFTENDYKNYAVGLLITVSTTVCCYLAYRFTSSNYGLSILLAVCAAWMIIQDITERKKSIIYLIISMCILVLCLAIYQANIGCFCVVIILYMMKLIYAGDNRKCLSIFLKALIVGFISCVVYKIAWDICMMVRHVYASDYNGADSLSIMGMLVGLPKSLRLIYRSWLNFFKYVNGYYVFRPIRILITLIIFATVIFVGAKKLKKKPANLVIYLLLCLCLPIGANICVILAPATNSILHQMTAPMMMVLPLLILYLDGLGINKRKAMIVMTVLLLYGNFIAVGTDIDALAQGSNTSYAIMNNIVDSLNQRDLLGKNYKYAFFGDISENELFMTNELYEKASSYAKFGTLMTKPDMARNAYNGLFDDIGLNLKSVEHKEYSEILNSGILDEMPAYPDKESIIEKDGVIIVKVSEDYKWNP